MPMSFNIIAVYVVSQIVIPGTNASADEKTEILSQCPWMIAPITSLTRKREARLQVQQPKPMPMPNLREDCKDWTQPHQTDTGVCGSLSAGRPEVDSRTSIHQSLLIVGYKLYLYGSYST